MRTAATGWDKPARLFSFEANAVEREVLRGRSSITLRPPAICYTNIARWGIVAILALRLPPDLEKRLDELAKATGRSKSFYARQAIVEHIAISKTFVSRNIVWKSCKPDVPTRLRWTT